MDRKYLRNLVNIVLFLVGVVLVCLLVPRLVIFFMPFVVGWIIALIANPLVRLMEKRLKIVRKHSSALIIVGTIALIVLGGYGILSWLVREIYGFIGVLPDLYEALLGDLETTSVNLAGISEKIPPELLEKLSATVHSLTESLGNVISTIGVPTVVDAATIVYDATGDREKIAPNLHGMFVTPKDIDETVKSLSFTISEALNLAMEGRT